MSQLINGIPMPTCGTCGNEIKIGQTFVGMPVLVIQEVGKSQMAGTEIIFHTQCFSNKLRSKKIDNLEIISAS